MQEDVRKGFNVNMATQSKLVEFPLEDGSSTLVEIEDNDPGPRPVSASGRAVERSRHSFDSAIGAIRPVANSIIREMKALENMPDKISVEFGIKMNSTVGLVIAQAESVSNFKVTLTWESDNR